MIKRNKFGFKRNLQLKKRERNSLLGHLRSICQNTTSKEFVVHQCDCVTELRHWQRLVSSGTLAKPSRLGGLA